MLASVGESIICGCGAQVVAESEEQLLDAFLRHLGEEHPESENATLEVSDSKSESVDFGHPEG